MEHRSLGNTGLKVSRLCMGTMQFGWSVDQADTDRILSAGFDAGINFIDTADYYSRWIEGNPGGVAETYIGDWMRKSGIPRDRLVIATKVGREMGDEPNERGLGRVHILDSVEASLRRLRCDYVDLYQTHCTDEATPVEETLRAFDDLVRQGKVRHIGASNIKAWQLMHALWVSDRDRLVRFDTLQPQYSLAWRREFEEQLRDVCRTFGLGVISYSALAGGFLTGKYRKGQPLPPSKRAQGRKRFITDRNFALLEAMDGIAAARGTTLSKLAIAWVLADPVITCPIIGPASLEQLRDNLGALELHLSAEDMAALNQASDWNT